MDELVHYSSGELAQLAEEHNIKGRTEILARAAQLAERNGKAGITFKYRIEDWTLMEDARTAVPAKREGPDDNRWIPGYDGLYAIIVYTERGATVSLLEGMPPAEDSLNITIAQTKTIDPEGTMHTFPTITGKDPLRFEWGCRVASSRKIVGLTAVGIQCCGEVVYG